MRLLIDECVPEVVTTVFAGRHHEIFKVVEELATKTPDNIIAQFTDSQHLTCVTWNLRHFHALISRKPQNNQVRFPNAGLIAFGCPEPSAERRLSQALEIIEFEHERAQARPDKRLIVHVMPEFIKVCR